MVVTLALAGDTMLGRGVGDLLADYNAPDAFVSDGVREYLSEADAILLNLECCVSSRGDSMFASGVLAVIALAAGAGLFARSILGERSRWLYAAAAGGILFGIVMIIVTFAASEAAELGVPSSMGGLASAVAPLAPLALGLGALGRARAAWVDPYSRSEAVRAAAFASAMLFLMLALSPVGVVRVHARPAHAVHKHSSI